MRVLRRLFAAPFLAFCAFGCAQPYVEGDLLRCADWYFYDQEEKARFATWYSDRAVSVFRNQVNEDSSDPTEREFLEAEADSLQSCLRAAQGSLVTEIDQACVWPIDPDPYRMWEAIEPILDSCRPDQSAAELETSSLLPAPAV